MSERRLARNAGASVAQVILSALAMLITYRLLMAWLTIEQIGLWALILGSTAVARLSEMGLGAGVLRFVAGDLMAGRRDLAAASVAMGALCSGLLVGSIALVSYPFLLDYLLATAPHNLDAEVHVLLPAALSGVVIMSVAGVFLNAIDGCQRMDIRAILNIASSLVQLVTTWVVLPRLGLAGLGWVQLAQATFLLVAGLGSIVILLGVRPVAYLHFDTARLRAMFTYGGGLQLAAIGQMLFEPLAKVLLTAHAGLALTGYYELANRLVLQCRAVIVSAYNAMVPHVAARAGSDEFNDDKIRSIYREASGVLFFVLLPYFAVLAASLPLALTLWKGHFDTHFLAVSLVVLAGWAVNMLTPPAYLMFVALGRLRWNIVSHLLIGALTALLGSVLGTLAGGAGVLVAISLALGCGSLLVLGAFHRECHVSLHELLPAGRIPSLALLVIAFAASASLVLLRSGLHWALFAIMPAIAIVAGIACMWIDPSRPLFASRIARLRRGRSPLAA